MACKHVVSIALALTLVTGLCPGLAVANEAPSGKTSELSAQALSSGSTAKSDQASGWKVSKGYATYIGSNGSLARGLVEIDGKTYLFDKKGRQKMGWQRVNGAYRFFNIGMKEKGAMVTGKVVNGIKLKDDGKASFSKAGRAELKIMVKAQKLAEKITKPNQSKKKKLKAGFNWMLNKCSERMIHKFSKRKGWHRTFANEIYNLKSGSCYSYGAAYAYYANAIGCKSCRIVSSGGHGWAEIGGKVYDIEWTRHRPQRYFAWPYSKSGSGGAPAYASSRIYVVQIAPKKSVW